MHMVDAQLLSDHLEVGWREPKNDVLLGHAVYCPLKSVAPHSNRGGDWNWITEVWKSAVIVKDLSRTVLGKNYCSVDSITGKAAGVVLCSESVMMSNYGSSRQRQTRPLNGYADDLARTR
jgi:hypothetical protein